MKKTLLAVAVAVGLVAASAGQAQAALVTYGFGCITFNSAANCAIGEAQLFVDVTDEGVGANQVAFVFRNLGPAASSITDVYFDDGTLLGIASIINGPGVSFSQGATPPNLPGGNTLSPAFVTTAGFLADSDPPVSHNGVQPGQFLTIVFNLINGQTYADTLNALLLGGAAGGLRIGIHVQGFPNGGSESFVNTSSVPEPTTLALLGMAFMLTGASLRRRL